MGRAPRTLVKLLAVLVLMFGPMLLAMAIVGLFIPPRDWGDWSLLIMFLLSVAMWFPLTANTPEVSNFFFLKELCFLIINDNAYGRFGRGTQDFDDLRRTGAVRCGAMILDEYSPVLALQYRRTFLDAVGAEESATMQAFDRVYYLDPSVLARLRAQVTMPR